MNGEDRRDEHGNGSSESTLGAHDAALLTELVVASLEPAELPEGGWERLRAEIAAERAVPSDAEASTRFMDASQDYAGRTPRASAVGRASRDASQAPTSVTASPRRWPPTAWAAAAVLVLALGGTLFWGYQQAAESARLRDDQRILAYWMSNPGMRLTSLQPAAGTEATRLGVLCVLPDGRALVLQPSPAGRGASYVVLGRGPDGVRELTRGTENMLQFDVSGVDMIELRLARADDAETLAWADLN